MSKEANGNTMLKTTKEQTLLKNDGCWIKTSNQEPDQGRTVPRRSYVLETAKKFDDSYNQANGEVIPSPQDAQPGGSTVETTNDAKPQAPTEKHIQKDTQSEETFANTTAKNKEEYVAVYQSKVEKLLAAADVCAEVHVAEQIQNGEPQKIPSTEENPKAVSPVEPAAAEMVEPEISDVLNATLLKEGVLQESIEAVAQIVTKSSLNTSKVLEETPGNKAALEISVKSESEKPCQQATETAPKGNREKGPPEQAASEFVKAKAEVAVASSPEISDVVDAMLIKDGVLQECAEAVAEIVTKSSLNTSSVLEDTPGNKAALEMSVEPMPDLSAEAESEGPSQRATETAPKGNREKGPPEQAAEKRVEAAADVAVESSTETPAVTRAVGENAPLPGNVDPVPDFVADTACESLSTAAAETPVKHEASGVKAAAAANPALKTGAEEVVEHEVQPVDNPLIKQSVEPTTERVADHVGELIIKDAFEPVTSSDAGSVEDKFSYRLIELSEASNKEPPTTEVAPKPPKDPKQSHTEETKLNQYSDDTNNSDMFKKSKKDPQSKQTQKEGGNSNVCSFCEKIIDGNVKIYFSEPAWTCHPECLKCCVCTKALGELLSPLFSHDQGFQCGTCFAETL
ncbi:uncharacterized protein AB9W97_008803 isoform 2-T2 [Spinachia spinachia]